MFSQVSVCPQSTTKILVHRSALLWRGRYASYWNAFLYLNKVAFPEIGYALSVHYEPSNSNLP